MTDRLAREDLPAIAERLRAGEPVVLPTDTVYGLCALPTVEGSVARLFELKGRAADVPVAVLCADTNQAFDLASGLTPAVRAVAEACWPGPLTLVLKRRPGLGWDLGEPAHTIGLRCPDHDLVRALAARVGPIAATSANRHGEPTAPTVHGVLDQLGDVAHVDGGRLAGAASTVVDATAEPWRVLREGAITPDALAAQGAPLH